MIMNGVSRLLARLAALLMLAGFAGVAAQSWPSRAVTLIVSQAPGTAPDFIARTLSVRMGERLKVGVIVDNRGGASGNIGAEYVAKAAPDGYTLYLAPSSFIMGSTISRNPRFDPIKSFASVLPLADGLQCLVVSGTSPIRSVKELVARAKASPAKLFYATPGNGTAHHFIMEQFKMEAGMDLVHVPYKGLPGAIVDLIAGRVDVMMMTTAAAAAHVQSGQLRMLAVVSPSRSPLSPDMPTLAEQGYPHVRGASWYGLLAPAGTPSEVLARLNTEMNAILAEKPVRDAFAKQGLEATGGAALRLAEAMASERELWRKIAELTGISAE